MNICIETLVEYLELTYDNLNLLKDCEIDNIIVKDEIIEAFQHVDKAYNELLKEVKLDD